jgi:hypothetical protein
MGLSLVVMDEALLYAPGKGWSISLVPHRHPQRDQELIDRPGR